MIYCIWCMKCIDDFLGTTREALEESSVIFLVPKWLLFIANNIHLFVQGVCNRGVLTEKLQRWQVLQKRSVHRESPSLHFHIPYTGICITSCKRVHTLTHTIHNEHQHTHTVFLLFVMVPYCKMSIPLWDNKCLKWTHLTLHTWINTLKWRGSQWGRLLTSHFAAALKNLFVFEKAALSSTSPAHWPPQMASITEWGLWVGGWL